MIPQFHVDTGNLRWELESLPRKLQSTVLKRVLRRPLKHTETRARALYATNRSALFREHLADHFWVKFKHYRVGVMWGQLVCVWAIHPSTSRPARAGKRRSSFRVGGSISWISRCDGATGE